MALNYVSKAGLSYFWGLIKTKLNAKQDTISDLSTIRTNAATGAGLKTKVDGIAEGAQVNVIETVKVNGTALTPTSKAVSITVPTQLSDIATSDQQAAANSGITSTKVADYDAYATGKQDVISDLETIRTNASTGAGLKSKVDGIAAGAQVNVIETVKVNGSALSVTSKAVDVTVPTQLSDIGTEVQMAAVNSGITAAKVSTYDGYAAGKQNALSEAQLAAVNSGVTSAKVAAWDLLDNAKADKATTLAGYGITDAYTKTEVDGKLTGAFHYKGTKASYAELPSTGNVQGDVWNITAADSAHNVKAGDNVVWNGEDWDVLSGIVDLSAYAKTADLVAVTNAEIDEIVNPSA